MELKLNEDLESLTPTLKALRLDASKIEIFDLKLQEYFQSVENAELEEKLKFYVMDLLKSIYESNYLVEQHGRVDFVIRGRNGKSKPLVLFETKLDKSPEMIRQNDINRKAFHEMVLYYMNERTNGNTDIRKLIINTEYRLYIFDASEFERTFFKNPYFRRQFDEWRLDQKSDNTENFFYDEIARKFIEENDTRINATFVDLNDYRITSTKEVNFSRTAILYKLLSPYGLLKIAVRNDSNILNRTFYDELLHIIGLEERKENGYRVISRLSEGKRNPGSLFENTIARLRGMPQFDREEVLEKYGTSSEDRASNIALELCLTWINRILFLKLLEAQLLKNNNGDKHFQFLNIKKVQDFSDLSDLFFLVLAVKHEKRNPSIREQYQNIPYLNSSLFERTDLERDFGINNLNNHTELPVYQKTVLKNDSFKPLKGNLTTLKYLFEFLESYDFGSVDNGEFQEDNKVLINASVLGLIFEKINGYQDGAIYTPGYITMHMARRVIEKTVLERFQKKFPDWRIGDLEDLKNYTKSQKSKSDILEFNKVIDELKICDPAVGSGHFLVSCLNELIALKSELGILADERGILLSDYNVSVENDELIVMHYKTNEIFNYRAYDYKIPSDIQFVQECLFHEKQKLIENCLFGVDININSVRICQLRLWIELLKCAYYHAGKVFVNGRVGELETLPSIDINIKCGNSLLSRFTFEESLESALKGAKITVKYYKSLIRDYKKSKQWKEKLDIQEKISNIKKVFQEANLNQLDKGIETKTLELKQIKSQLALSIETDAQVRTEKKLAEVSKSIIRLKDRRELLVKHKTFLSAFEWRYEFPEVLDNKGNFLGFDIIVTNPPYMRVQEIERTQSEQKNIYERNFPITTTGSYDLANIFFELALSISKQEGNNIFIFPNKVFNTENGASLRHYLLNNRAVKQITHFGANQIFDGVTTYSCIVLFNSHQTDSLNFRRFELNEDIRSGIDVDANFREIQYSQIENAASLYGRNLWILFNDPIGYDLFDKCCRSGSRVDDVLKVYVGLQTSRDSLYVSEKLEETEDRFKIQVNPKPKSNPSVEPKQFWVEKKFFKPMLMGEDVHRYSGVNSNRLVFFPYLPEKDGQLVSSKELADKFPLTWKFVTYYENSFKTRENGKAKKEKEYYAYIYRKNLLMYEKEKLLSMEICTHHPNITLDTHSTYHNTEVYGLTLKDGIEQDYRYFLGILNSKLFWWFLKHTGDTLRGDGRRVKTKYVNPFPLPANVDRKKEQAVVSIVDKLLNCKAGEVNNEELEKLEYEVNSAVYQLYGLEESEIQLIESSC